MLSWNQRPTNHPSPRRNHSNLPKLHLELLEDRITPVMLTALTPADDSFLVPLDTHLALTFDENVQLGTGNITIVTAGSDTPFDTFDVATSAQVNASGDTVTIDPTSDLSEGTTYFVRVDPSAITDTTGDPFAGFDRRSTWNFQTIPDAPLITNLSPGDDATRVEVDANLSVTFHEDVQFGTGHITLKRLIDDTDVEVFDVTSSAQLTIIGNTLTIDPTNDLDPTTGYYVVIDSGAIEDTSANDFAGITAKDQWNFFITVADSTGPSVTSLTPTDNATDITADTNLVLEFDEPIQKGTGTITIKKVSDDSVVTTIDVTSALVTVSGSTATINPTGSLDPDGTEYSIQVDPGAFRDTATGTDVTLFAEDFESLPLFPLPTETAAVDDGTDWTDTPPAGWTLDNSGMPGGGVPDWDGWSFVDKEVWISAVGNQERDRFTKGTGTVAVADPDEWDDAAHNPGTFNSFFRTPAISLEGVAESSLVLTFDSSFRPFANQTGTVEVAFNGGPFIELLRLNTANSGGNDSTSRTNESISININNPAGGSAVFRFGLTEGSNDWWWALDHLQLTGDIIAANAFAGITDNTTWTFTTVDTTPPNVSTFSPADNAVDVPVDSNLSITFDEPVQLGTGTIVIRRSTDHAVVESFDVATSSPVSVAGNVLTIDPTNELESLTGYYVRIDPGAIQDAEGNPFAGIGDTTTWNFTTIDAAPPVVTTFTPADDSIGVPVTSDLAITFDEVIEFGVGHITLRNRADDSVVETFDVTNSPQLSIAGNTLTIDPTNDLADNTEYYLRIDPLAIRDRSPNEVTTTLLVEDFEGLLLQPFQSPTESGGDGTDWTAIGPVGWIGDPGTTPTGGPPEFFGWTFLDVDSWVATQGNHGRADFTLGGVGSHGTVAVSDPDAYDDGTNIDPDQFNAFLSTPSLDLTGFNANSVTLMFDSSFRTSGNLTGIVEVSFDNGANFAEVLRLDQTNTVDSPTAANVNDTISLHLDNPATGSLIVRFGTISAGNDGWWAIDNVRIKGSITGNPYAGIAANTTLNFSTNDAPTVNNQTFRVDENSAAGTVTGSVVASDPESATLTYSIIAGNDAGAFAIDPGTGEITVATPTALDFETTPSFTLTILVEDHGQPNLTASATITIHLDDVNESPRAADDRAATTASTPVTIPVLANDHDPDGDDLSVTQTSSPGNGTVVINVDGTLTYLPNTDFTGNDSFTYTIDDGKGETATATVNVTVEPTTPSSPPASSSQTGFHAVSGGEGQRQILFYRPDGTLMTTITPFAHAPGGIRTVVADVTGDGRPDVIAGTGPGVSTQVKIFDGVTFDEVGSFEPFEPGFTGGVFLAAGDLNGDGKADWGVSPDRGGGPRLRIFAGGSGEQIADYFAIEDPHFRGGLRVAFADLNGDDIADILAAAGFLGGPRVALWNGARIASGDTSGETAKFIPDFFVFEPSLRNGVFIGGGDITGDGFDDLIVGGGPDGGPRVFGLSGHDLVNGTQTQVANFFAGDIENRGGIRVAGKDLNDDAHMEIVTGSGTDALGTVHFYDGVSVPADGEPEPIREALVPFGEYLGGIFVG